MRIADCAISVLLSGKSDKMKLDQIFLNMTFTGPLSGNIESLNAETEYDTACHRF